MSKLPLAVCNTFYSSVLPLDTKVNMMSTSTVCTVHFALQGSDLMYLATPQCITGVCHEQFTCSWRNQKQVCIK